MISLNKEARIPSVMALLVALVSTGVEAKEPKTQKNTVETVLVRATEYHKSDPDCDPETRKGKTSTKLKLPKEDSVVTDPNTIGDVAVDTNLFPGGSLVLETQTDRLFVATKGGKAVLSRVAAKKTAQKKKLPQVFHDAVVFDFYYPEKIVQNEYTHCWVIPYQGEKEFWRLNKESQEKRLTPEFWLPRLQSLCDSSTNEAEKQKLRKMMKRLEEMI